MKRFVLNIILLSLSMSLFGQKTKVTGIVLDAATGDTLPFVNIFFQDTKIGTSSNLDGVFTLESYYASDTIVASFVGYKIYKNGINKDESQTLTIKLAPSTDLAMKGR